MSLKVDLKTQETRRRFSIDFGWILVIAVIFFCFMVFYFFDVKLQDSINKNQIELQSWQDKIERFASVKTQVQEIKQSISSIQNQINQVRELYYDPLRYSILLTRISQLLPENLWLRNLSIDPDQSQISLAGSAIEMSSHAPLSSVADFIANLQNDPRHYFSNIILQTTTASEKGGNTPNIWSFDIRANFNVSLLAGSSEVSPKQRGLP